MTPHPDGDWLVTTGGTWFAVPPRLGRALLPLQGIRLDRASVGAFLDGVESSLSKDEIVSLEALAHLLLSGSSCSRSLFALSGSNGGARRRALWLRIPMIPGRLVGLIASKIRVLASWPALTALVLLGAGGYLLPWLIPDSERAVVGVPQTISGTVVVLSLLLFLITALWHEFGHAAALSRQGYPPGGIGAGLLFVIPVLFADVTPIGALPRKGKARVDVAGVCFQVGLGGVLFALGSLVGNQGIAGGSWPNILATSSRSAGIMALAAVVWSLFPFIRSDGYWLMCDLLRVPNPERPLSGSHTWRLTWFLVVYRLLNVAFLLIVAGVISFRILHLWGILIEWLGWPTESYAMTRTGRILQVMVMALMGFGLFRRVTGMLRSSWMDLRRLGNGRFENRIS